MVQERPKEINENDLKKVLKFDTGADGFMKMIYVLAITAIIVLMVGFYFINLFKRELNAVS